jgi:hypothetical protein
MTRQEDSSDFYTSTSERIDVAENHFEIGPTFGPDFSARENFSRLHLHHVFR